MSHPDQTRVPGMLNYLLSDSVNRTLTDWEREFVDKLSELPEEQALTQGQWDKLSEIYLEH